MTPVNSNIFIALGSNLGDREGNILRGVAEIARISGSRVTALSSFYDTEPVGMESTDNFINAVLRLESSLSPEELLTELMRIETDTFGRKRAGGVEPRRLDLDILFYGTVTIDNPPGLVIPHPRLQERRFVLEPLAEIAPAFRDPLSGRTASELLSGLQDDLKVTRL